MKTADQLTIRQEELDALLWVRDQIASGAITHHDSGDQGSLGQIDMATDVSVDSCGTVCCIGGWMALRMSEQEHHADRRAMLRAVSEYMYTYASGRLSPLFFPMGSRSSWPSIPTDQIVRTIDFFLETGAVVWTVGSEPEVLPLGAAESVTEEAAR